MAGLPLGAAQEHQQDPQDPRGDRLPSQGQDVAQALGTGLPHGGNHLSGGQESADRHLTELQPTGADSSPRRAALCTLLARDTE